MPIVWSPVSYFVGKKNARLKGLSGQMMRGHNISTPFVCVTTPTPFVWAQRIYPICMGQNNLSHTWQY